jgi:hypothetical protein
VDYIDNYCERLAPGLWGEPANAVTNAAFLIASALLVRLLVRTPERVPVSVWLLPVTTGVVGLCSLAFHTLATRFTGLLDTLSIAVFILIAVTVTVNRVWSVPWRWAWIAAPGYLAVAAALTAALAAAGGAPILGGYLSALLVLIGFGVAIRATAPAPMRPFGVLLLWAAALFAVSLTLRTVDGPLCTALPIGTHFLWHCLNATVLFLVSYAVFRCWRTAPSGSPDPHR